MKRILFICPYPFDVAAGQRLKFEPHYPKLRQEGYQIEIDSFMSIKLWDRVYEQGHFLSKIFWTLVGFCKRVLLIPSLQKYDCIYIFMNVFPFGPPILEKIYRLKSKRIVYDLEDNMFSNEPEGGNWLASLFKSRSKYEFLISTSDQVIASSPFLVHKCKEISQKNNIHFIPPTLSLERFTEKPKKLKNSEKVVIGWTGTIGSKVFLDELIPTLEKLHSICEFKLMVIGNFGMSHDFIDLEVVKWNAKEEIDQLHRFDIGIYPLPQNEWIGGKSGLKALQYMAIGIPSVCTATGNVVNFIDDNVDGFLIKDEKEWLDCLESLIKDKERRENIGKEARKKFIKRFSHQQIFKQYFNLIESGE